MIPLQTRNGKPICILCDLPMEQVGGPSDEFPGGLWQCPEGKALSDHLDNMFRRMAERIMSIGGQID